MDIYRNHRVVKHMLTFLPKIQVFQPFYSPFGFLWDMYSIAFLWLGYIFSSLYSLNSISLLFLVFVSVVIFIFIFTWLLSAFSNALHVPWGEAMSVEAEI